MLDQRKGMAPEDRIFETNDRSLMQLERQLYDFSLAQRAGSSQIKMIHGSHLVLALCLFINHDREDN